MEKRFTKISPFLGNLSINKTYFYFSNTFVWFEINQLQIIALIYASWENIEILSYQKLKQNISEKCSNITAQESHFWKIFLQNFRDLSLNWQFQRLLQELIFMVHKPTQAHNLYLPNFNSFMLLEWNGNTNPTFKPPNLV